MNPKLQCLLVAILLFAASHAQKMQLKDLIGTWHLLSSSKSDPPLQFTFSEGNHFKMSMMEIMAADCTFSIDTTNGTSKLYLKGKTATGANYNDTWLVRKNGDDTLKFQAEKFFELHKAGNVAKMEWDEKETPQNTGIAVRAKN